MMVKAGTRQDHNKEYGASVVVLLIIAVLALIFCSAEKAYAETPVPGQDLEIRIGYCNDDNDYRIKAVLTREQVEQLGMETYYYSNLSTVGSVAGTVAKGPKLDDVISAAGIDINDTKMIYFRVFDSPSEDNYRFPKGSIGKEDYLSTERYYYPNWRSNYEIDDERYNIPGVGALEGGVKVPAIIAVQSYTTKTPSGILSEELLSDDKSYRFCIGQPPLEECVPSNAVTSISVYWIFGLDIQLSGNSYDVMGISLTAPKTKVKVGEKLRLGTRLKGRELFEDKVRGELKWSSSDTGKASVDSAGTVTFKNKGNVAIKVRDANKGKSASKTFTVSKVQQKMLLKSKLRVLRYKTIKLRKHRIIKPITVSNAKGKITFKKISGSHRLVLSSKGVLTVKKGTRKGLYKARVRVSASGNNKYYSAEKSITVRIRVK